MTYLGNSPYCYANTLAMTLGSPISATIVEVLTSSAFGYQRIGPLPLFDPPGWHPDTGLNQALRIMGIRHDRLTFVDADEALEALRRLACDGPVFVGPLDMGLLRHQDGSDRPIGADHFVAVLDVDDERIIMHDPQGHPFASLPTTDFMNAWGCDTIKYGEGQFPLRTGFTPAVGGPEEWVTASLPDALNWAEGNEAVPAFPPGNEAGLVALAEEANSGAMSDATAYVLRNFALRLGARRRSDTADALVRYPALATLMRDQGKLIGSAQLAAIDSDWPALAATFTHVAELHTQIVEELRSIVN